MTAYLPYALTLVTGVVLGFVWGDSRADAFWRRLHDESHARRDASADAVFDLMRGAARDMQVANDRLYAAWKDGYTIPEPDVEPEPDEPLPDALAEWVAQWEDVAAREKWDAEIRRRIASGRTADQILMDLEVA
jgi:hypothetical protein